MKRQAAVGVTSRGCDAGVPAFSIATLVTEPGLYAEMVASFEGHGFLPDDCEFLSIDNSAAQQADAYQGLNALLDAARAPYVILCHQDVRLIGDDRSALEARLDDLETLDARWALAGNAGGVAPGVLSLRISDPHGRDRRVGTFPARVQSLDENFIVVKRSARVGFSHDLSGFHFYGADICLHAAMMGCTSYVIDFHLEHLSAGRKSADFFAAESAFRDKWSKAMSARWLQTTCSLVRLSGLSIDAAIGRAAAVPLSRIARRLPTSRGFKPKGPRRA